MPFLSRRSSGSAASPTSVGQNWNASLSPTDLAARLFKRRSPPSQGQNSTAPAQRKQSPQSALAAHHVLGIPFKDVRQFYRLGQELGRGVSGIVHSCVDRRTGETFACKSILKVSLTSYSHVCWLRNEVKIMLNVGNHPAVVSLHDVCEDDEAVHLIMDLCEGGDLFDRIKQQKQYPEKEAARVCRILISVLQHCNSMGIMHRDYKPENILLTSTESHTAIKVGDFGQAAFYEPGKKLTHAVGTGFYIAPEVLSHSYGPEADIWSIGVILFTLLSGKLPFWAADKEGVFAKIERGVFDLEHGPWESISTGAKDLVCQMLCSDPTDRITPEEIKAHPWILEHCNLRVQSHTAASLRTLVDSSLVSPAEGSSHGSRFQCPSISIPTPVSASHDRSESTVSKEAPASSTSPSAG